jgi:hypothetical protein
MNDPLDSNPAPARVPVKCISIVLCEAAYSVANTSNMIIVNTFHALSSSNYPCPFPKITVLYTVTDGHGSYDLSVSIVNASTGQTTLEVRQPCVLDNPLTILDAQVIMHQVLLPSPGKYWVEIRCDGELIGQRPFYAGATAPPPPALPGMGMPP